MSNDKEQAEANPGYAALQLCKALETATTQSDQAIVDRAERKASRWVSVLKGMSDGSILPGSRRPTAAPEWVTLEVVHGGFATGSFLSGGPLSASEKQLLEELPESDLSPRLQLNGYFLSEVGIDRLNRWLEDGKYQIDTPEEGALLTVAWLLSNGDHSAAEAILDEITPWFDELRFYPESADSPNQAGSLVHVQDVAEATEKLKVVRSSKQVLAQREAIQIWAPLYDKLLALALKTVDGEIPSVRLTPEGKPKRDTSGSYQISGGWPGSKSLPEWPEKATNLLLQIKDAQAKHKLCTKYHKPKHPFYVLHKWVGHHLKKKEISAGLKNRVRLILGRSFSVHGVPGDTQRIGFRAMQQEMQVQTPNLKELAEILLARISSLPLDGGIENPENIYSNPEGAVTDWPKSLKRKIDLCRVGTVSELIEDKLIPSGDTLALVMPQITAGIRSMGLDSPEIRRLYELCYRAFRRRRSLLLLNLDCQIRIEEIPWIAAVDSHRSSGASDEELALHTLKDVVRMNLKHFPQAIIPNKLLQEIRALAKTAKLQIPLVDELAADIFMGSFTSKFVEATVISQELLTNSLYQRYYKIEKKQLRRLDPKSFASVCYQRAAVKRSKELWGRAAENGMVIEQQQILTTQNLGTLISLLGLQDDLRHEGMQAA